MRNFKLDSYRSNSNAERYMCEVLDRMGLNYHREISFDNLRGIKGGLLRYDFGIYDTNDPGDILYFIECDDITHHPPCSDSSEYKAYLITEEHDSRKNMYCLKHNTDLIRIPVFMNLNQITPENLIPETTKYLVDSKTYDYSKKAA